MPATEATPKEGKKVSNDVNTEATDKAEEKAITEAAATETKWRLNQQKLNQRKKPAEAATGETREGLAKLVKQQPKRKKE